MEQGDEDSQEEGAGTAGGHRRATDSYKRVGKMGEAALMMKRGNAYSRKSAQKGGQANGETSGSQHFSQMGKKGGKTTKERQGPGFYRRIGKLGRAARHRRRVATGQQEAVQVTEGVGP